jgi:hypothetical protein
MCIIFILLSNTILFFLNKVSVICSSRLWMFLCIRYRPLYELVQRSLLPSYHLPPAPLWKPSDPFLLLHPRSLYPLFRPTRCLIHLTNLSILRATFTRLIQIVMLTRENTISLKLGRGRGDRETGDIHDVSWGYRGVLKIEFSKTQIATRSLGSATARERLDISGSVIGTRERHAPFFETLVSYVCFVHWAKLGRASHCLVERDLRILRHLRSFLLLFESLYLFISLVYALTWIQLIHIKS